MEELTDEEEYGLAGKHSLGTWARIYLHGFLAIVAICLVAYAVTRLVPIFEFTGNRFVAIGLSVTTILAGPPILGSLILYVIFPLLGKKEAWRGLLVWDDRLLSELSGARQRAQIVIINWPSHEVRTIGVLTATFQCSRTGNELAAVYVPTAPQTKLGYIRVVPLSEMEFTDWTFKQWQLYQFTFGSSTPEVTQQSEK